MNQALERRLAAGHFAVMQVACRAVGLCRRLAAGWLVGPGGCAVLLAATRAVRSHQALERRRVPMLDSRQGRTSPETPAMCRAGRHARDEHPSFCSVGLSVEMARATDSQALKHQRAQGVKQELPTRLWN